MAKPATYKEIDDKKCKEKTLQILSELPEFVTEYSYDLANDVTARTKLAYMYDVRRFLRWVSECLLDEQVAIKDITTDVINNITVNDINRYKSFLEVDEKNSNGPRGEARKMSSLNSLLDFLYRTDKISGNPFKKIRAKKRKPSSPPIIRLQPNETVAYLDCIDNEGGDNATDRQSKFLAHSKTRDVAIVTLLLGTGIRVSECVGLNISDINFNELTILVTRKGNKRQKVAMSDEVIHALKAYLAERREIETKVENDPALFLSSQRKRMSVKTVENLIKKYAQLTGIQKNITPHKLRKTYGTELYNETGDIYLVARALGHQNVNTTKEHYILSDENSLLNARNIVKLRDKD